MVKHDKKNANGNEFLLRALTSVYILFIGSFIYLLLEMTKMGYETLSYVFNITFSYLLSVQFSHIVAEQQIQL